MAMSNRVFIEEYQHFWDLGYDIDDIAQIFGISKDSVAWRADKLGLPRYRGRERRTAEIVDEAVERGGLIVVERLPEHIDGAVAKARIKHHVLAGRIDPEPQFVKSFKRNHPPMAWRVLD